MSVVVEKDDEVKGRFESEVNECQSPLLTTPMGGNRGRNARGRKA